MNLESAIQQYLIEAKETAPRDQVEFHLAVLARLQEELEAEAGGEEGEERSADAVSGADLREFLRTWYRAEEELSPAAAKQVVNAILGFAAWLDRKSRPATTVPLWAS